MLRETPYGLQFFPNGGKVINLTKKAVPGFPSEGNVTCATIGADALSNEGQLSMHRDGKLFENDEAPTFINTSV